MSDYNTNIVKKPWGYEYLVYENKDVALWFLYIAPGQSTSMHCHPKKTTGLVLLDGEVEISFLADKRQLKSLDKVMIRRGLFHSTKATSENGAFVFEIETPVDKQDLVRLNDLYGRESKPYEDSTFEESKNVCEFCSQVIEDKS
jgi:quercetin dioxygenase-like cupin family protein